MKRKNLYLLCGVPGSGKSTFAKNFLETHDPYTTQWTSRDLIRFGMINLTDNYFEHEDEVWDLFIKSIKADIKSPITENIIVDATHLNERARNKVLDKLDLGNVDVIPVNFIVPLEVCLERNLQREGLAVVPESAIKNMYKSFRPATADEKHEYKEIWVIKS